MDKLEHYRQSIQALLTEYAAIPVSKGQISFDGAIAPQYDEMRQGFLINKSLDPGVRGLWGGKGDRPKMWQCFFQSYTMKKP